ncbi:hypothetical protein [Blastococcus brunescens]|uniref:Uncharacterized protein n=1 Tax=Blastococcus brunescens TaxID=1564165 RepID=A0ABZ1B4N3_9ACTN|nr:hypothetical protein [Blastococcus sp. BMG 8361]WRL65684.1 hypothetical protein U6N30_08935 [Blastococcus sp. BMG 8361]
MVPVGGRTLWSTSADLVWFNAMEALLWAAVWLVGWGPNAVHALTGDTGSSPRAWPTSCR